VSASPATWLAWLLWVAIMVFGASLLELYQRYWFWYVLTHPFIDPRYLSDVLTSGILIFAVPAYSTVGAIVASLRPKNGVGWLCLALSLVMVVGSWQPENVALMGLASILSGAAWTLTPLTVTLLLLVFPDGRLPSRRWWVVVGMGVGTPLLALLGALTESLQAYSVAELLVTVAFSIALVALAASAVAVVLRWRRSRDQERQQIKWLVYMVAVTVVAILSAFTSLYVLNDIPGAESYPTVLATVVALASVALGIPVAVGIAILKYRLYDIDLVINRTLVYGSLTALLALVYFAGVATTQVIFRGLTGQEEQPQLAIVVSTLVIAALFNPLRRRIQSFIDRRFYRNKYDATKTLEAFSAKLRDETDLDALREDLVGVVKETMQPSHVSLWLRPDTTSKGQQTD
jgi:hypothetical protein